MSEEKTTVKKSEKKGGEGKEKKNSNVVIIIIGIIIIALLATLVVIVLTKKDEPEESVLDRETIVNEKNVDEIVEAYNNLEKVPMGDYEVSMTVDWHFPSGTAASTDSYVENSEANNNAVFFDLQMAGTGEVIYSSPILSIGAYVEHITLDTALENGVYDCICVYHMLDENNNDTGRTVSIATKVAVGN